MERGSGILLHPTALPGPYGIGTLGAQALAFIDWLADGGQKYWQICPLVPTGYGDSPYQGFSAFAGNPYLIDIDDLLSLGLLTTVEAEPLSVLPKDHVDFGALFTVKHEVLGKAWKQFTSEPPETMAADLAAFHKTNADWLDDYALFMVVKDLHGGDPWNLWREDLRYHDSQALEAVRREQAEKVGYHVFVQYLFHRQWTAVKSAAADKGIQIIGDLPIFISYDSSDCWARPDLFLLDENRRPTHVAGVPPDYFSATGQLWGNPLYDWQAMEGNGFAWWIALLRRKLEQYDILRIDHFRGFEAYWEVPFGEDTAINGQWVKAPGSALFRAIREALGQAPIIAEDLGVITDQVRALMNECGFPGMKVLQFAFDSGEENDYLPHSYNHHCLVYTGTHDNDTAAGWFEAAGEKDRQFASDYLNIPKDADGKTAAAAMIRASLSSVADIAVTPLQDVLGLGSEARFNTPGTLGGGNWAWRCRQGDYNAGQAARLRHLTKTFGR